MNVERLADLLGVRPEWQRRAACHGVDPDLFFTERGGSTKEAKEVCHGCAVREQCLDYALTDTGERFGIWGGLSERERRLLRRKLRAHRESA
jgi:WhiB family transcriptional regulator, redox-sensing transcriptional regulator